MVGTDYHDFLSETFCPKVPQKFGEEYFSVSRFSVIEKIMHKRGMPRFSFEKLLSHSTGKPRRGNLLCFRIFLVSNNFMDKRGGVSRFCVRSLLSHRADKNHRGIF